MCALIGTAVAAGTVHVHQGLAYGSPLNAALWWSRSVVRRACRLLLLEPIPNTRGVATTSYGTSYVSIVGLDTLVGVNRQHDTNVASTALT